MARMRKMEGGGWTGTGRTLGMLIVQLLLLFVGHVPEASGALATSQCVQVGQGNTNLKGDFEYNIPHRDGPWTIGTRKFDSKYIFLDYSVEGNEVFENKFQHTRCSATTSYGHIRNIWFNPCPPDSEVEIRTYAVWQNNQVMNGWLHFEVELKDRQKYGDILAIYVQVRDEYFNAIGEFITQPEEQCSPSIPELILPSEYQILPCSAVGLREAKISYALYVMDEDMLRFNSSVKFLSNGGKDKLRESKGIHFTWRMSEYWCNRHLRIRPEAFIFTTKMAAAIRKSVEPKMMRKAANQWIHHRWYGAADIKLPGTKLDCSKKAIDYDYDNGNLHTNNAPWLQNTTNSELGNEYFIYSQWFNRVPNDYTVRSMKTCQDDPRKMDPQDHGDLNYKGYPRDTVPTFSGRCLHHYEKHVSHDNLQGCNLNESASEFVDVLKQNPNMQTYRNYTDELYLNRTKLCSHPCTPPKTTEHLGQILAFKDNMPKGSSSSSLNYSIQIRQKNKYSFLLTGRKYHAVMSVVWSMFLLPVGNFMSRYFKETCMNKACSGLHLWYCVHVGCSIMAGVVFTSSLLGLSDSINTWGRTVHDMANLHFYLGYGSFLTFLMLLFFGWMRGLTITCRRGMMFLHTLLGFTVYTLNNAAMILSAWIPGSPTMGDDCEGDKTPKDMGKPIFVIAAWIALDAVFQIVMTTLYCLTDKKYKISRPCWFPLVPLMPFNSTKDYKGSFARRVIMLMYLGSAFLMTNITVGLMSAHVPNNTDCLNFTMTCNTTKEANRYGCSKAAMKYAELIPKY